MTMNPATAGGPYRVPHEGKSIRSLTMAIAMHAGLLFFLWIGVRWQNTEPVAVEAEVWDMTAQQAAPPLEAETPPEPTPDEPDLAPPPETAPPPPVAAPPAPDPEIALEKRRAEERAERRAEEKRQAKLREEEEEREEKARKLAEKKLAEKKAKELAEKKARDEEKEAKRVADEKTRDEKKQAEKLAKAKADAEQKKLDKLREAEMKRMAGVLGATGVGARSAAPKIDAGYQAAIRAKVQGFVSYSGAKQDVEAIFRVTQLPTGEIMSVRKIKASGNPAYDSAVENAITRASPLPKKKDGTVDRELELVFNLKDLH